MTTAHFVCPSCALQRGLSRFTQPFMAPLGFRDYFPLPDLPFRTRLRLWIVFGRLNEVNWLHKWKIQKQNEVQNKKDEQKEVTVLS